MNQNKFKNIATILLLIFFFPVGLYLMWAKTNWNKHIKIAVSAFLAICFILGLAQSGNTEKENNTQSTINTATQETTKTSNISNLEFVLDDTIELTLNDENNDNENSYFKVTSNREFSVNAIEFISENPNIAAFTYDRTEYDKYVYFNIDAVGVGETYIYVQTKDKATTSEKIKVVVKEKETTTATTTSTTEKTTQSTTKITTTVQEVQEYSRTVYITPTGKRYHFSSSCGGKNSYAVSIESAKSQGLTPCQKCAN